jgi:hypothetical protein
MGIAKNIEAYSTYDYYTSNTDEFIQKLSDKLEADFIINVYDTDYNHIGEEDTHTSFGKNNLLRLTIEFIEYNINSKTYVLPNYELIVPIQFAYENTLSISFFPNNSLHITFLTFEHLWRSFIDELKFIPNWDRQIAIDRYERLRNEYKPIFKKIGIEKLFITTDAYYHIENITDCEDYRKITFDDIINEAKRTDKLIAFDFGKILGATHQHQLSSEFANQLELSIALIDFLE